MRRIAVFDLRPDMVLARSVFSENGHLLLGAGVQLNERYVEMLRSRGFAYVDIQDPDTDDLQIEDVISERTRINVSRHTYRVLSAMEQATEHFRDKDPIVVEGELSSDTFGAIAREWAGYEDLLGDLRAIVDEVAGQALVPGMLTLRSYDNYLFLHSIDSTIVAVMIGRKLGFDRNRLRQLAAGCILHDIGMVLVDRELVQKPGRLEPEELSRVRQHPRLGYEMLRQIRPRDVIANHVAYQHHERQDAGGYPRRLNGTNRVSRSELDRHRSGRILLDAEICAVADAYDALGADRPYRPALPPDQVVRTLRALAGPHLNREIVNHLLEMVPVYPLGSEVVVRTGPFQRFRGVVSRVDRQHLDRPVVRLLYDPRGERIEPMEIDLRREDALIASAPVRERPAARAEAPATTHAPVPAAPTPSQPAATPGTLPSEVPEPAEEIRSARILVVDDDPSIGEVLEDALTEAGYAVEVADTGRGAIEHARRCDLMLLDLGLPDVDGIEVCRALRASAEFARLPIMMLTARGDPVDRVSGIQSGADDYLAKPFDLAELLARIEALLRSRQIEQALRERNRHLSALRELLGRLMRSVDADDLAQSIADAVPQAFGKESGVLGAVVCAVDPDRRLIRGHAVTDIPLARRALDLLKRPLREFGSPFDPPRNLVEQVALTGQPRAGRHLLEFVAPTVPNPVCWAIEQVVGMRGGLALPARAEGQMAGVVFFVLTKPLDQVTPTERGLMAELTETAGAALRAERLRAATRAGSPGP